jgi:hypothetical protein
MTDCRIEFALLPTVCSLPVAFHPASRRRSYLQLSGAGLTQVRTFTQLFVCTCRRTRTCRPWRVPHGVRTGITSRLGKPSALRAPQPDQCKRKEDLSFMCEWLSLQQHSGACRPQGADRDGPIYLQHPYALSPPPDNFIDRRCIFGKILQN